MLITQEFVEKIDPCDGGREWFSENNMYGKNSIKIIKLLIKQGHLPQANWLILRTMEYKQCVSYAAYAATAATDAATAAATAAANAYAADAAAYAAYAYAAAADADKKEMQLKILNHGIELLKGKIC